MASENGFRITRLDEPEIHFHGGSDVSPKRGLMEHGPRLINNEHQAINVAAIGDSNSIRLLNDMFLDWGGVIHPDETDEKIRPWRIPFPGLNSRSNLNTSIAFPDRWRYRITNGEIRSIKAHSTRKNNFKSL